jgi:hypothetical protein
MKESGGKWKNKVKESERKKTMKSKVLRIFTLSFMCVNVWTCCCYLHTSQCPPWHLTCIIWEWSWLSDFLGQKRYVFSTLSPASNQVMLQQFEVAFCLQQTVCPEPWLELCIMVASRFSQVSCGIWYTNHPCCKDLRPLNRVAAGWAQHAPKSLPACSSKGQWLTVFISKSARTSTLPVTGPAFITGQPSCCTGISYPRAASSMLWPWVDPSPASYAAGSRWQWLLFLT